MSHCLNRRALRLATVFIAAAAALPDAAGAQAVGARQAAGAQAPAAYTGMVVSANQGDNTVFVIDATTGATLARLTGFTGPHEVAISGSGRWAVISNYGDEKVKGDTLSVIDLQSLSVVRTIPMGEYLRPHDVHFLRGDSLLAVTSEVTSSVVLVRFADGAIAGRIDTGGRLSHMLAVTPDGSRIFSANIADGNVSEMSVATRTNLGVHATGPADEGIAITPDGTQLWSASLAKSEVTVKDTRTWETLAVLPAAGHPYRVTISADGKTAYVPAPELDLIRVFDVATRKEVQYPMEGGPGRINLSPDGAVAYVPLMSRGTIGVLDLSTMKILRELTTGASPDGVGVSLYKRLP